MSSCCLPTHGVRLCSGDTCRACSAPTYAFPDQPQYGQLAPASQFNSVASTLDPYLHHNEPILLVSGTYYQFNGSLFLHLASNDRLGFTSHPIWPLSDAFYFRVKKFPVTGIDVTPDGRVPYQSFGDIIREGDLVTLESPMANAVLGSYRPPNAYNLPVFGPDLTTAVQEFQSYGTQASEVLRIISEDYDRNLPRDQQPPVLLDGSKAYFFEYTRTGQSLSVLPGQFPAPDVVKISEYKGPNTRIIPISPSIFYPKVSFNAAMNNAANAAANNAVNNPNAANIQNSMNVANNAAMNATAAVNNAMMNANANAAAVNNAVINANNAALANANNAIQQANNALNNLAANGNAANANAVSQANAALNQANAALQNISVNQQAMAQNNQLNVGFANNSTFRQNVSNAQANATGRVSNVGDLNE